MSQELREVSRDDSSDPPTETDLLRKIETAIEEVVRADPGMRWVPDGNKTKRQKYVDCAVSHFAGDSAEMPVTRSWFRYGRTLPAADSGTGNFGSDQNLPPRGNVLEETTIDEFIDFFESIAAHPPLTADWWNEDIFEFLEEYYSHHAPDRYRDVYLHTLEMRRIFEESRESIANLRTDVRRGSEVDLSPINRYEDITEIDAKLQLELVDHETLSPAFEPMRAFHSLSERVFFKLSTKQPDDLGPEYLYIVGRLDEFFDDVVWSLPAALMSSASKEGPNKDWLAESAGKLRARFDESYDDDLDGFRRKCAEEGVLPSVEDYDSEGDEVDEAIEGLLRVADREHEQ